METVSMDRTDALSKVLSKNDTGETGSHQAGILIPKQEDILCFFPPLTTVEKNPRHKLKFSDGYDNCWEFSFIYYNNKHFGGTRNEYRLTCMTPFMKANNLKEGDTITLHRKENQYAISFMKKTTDKIDDTGRLVLGTSWKVVKI
jgi:hypothetical protein